jgi:hypothetical protein
MIGDSLLTLELPADDLAVVPGQVGEGADAGDVTAGPDARCGDEGAVIDLDPAPVSGADAGRSEVEPLQLRSPTDRD